MFLKFGKIKKLLGRESQAALLNLGSVPSILMDALPLPAVSPSQ